MHFCLLFVCSARSRLPNTQVGHVGGDVSLPTFRLGNMRKMIGRANFTSRKLGLPIIPTSTECSIILTVVDVMSRFAFARPIKHKNGQEVAEALEDIFTDSKKHPKFYLQTDKGKEFFNKHVKELASKYGFCHFHTYDRDIKAAVVERFNRTLKEMIWRYFTWTNTRKWVTNSQGEDMLAKFVNAYNHRQHITLGMSPLQTTKHDQNEIYDSTMGKHLKWKQKRD